MKYPGLNAWINYWIFRIFEAIGHMACALLLAGVKTGSKQI
jgi:hypothetical protein